MKNYIFVFACLFALNYSAAQNVAINTSGNAADASAILDVSSTNSGLLIPRMTGGNMTGIASPATGLIVYNTTMANFYYNQGTPGTPNWVPLSNATSGWYTSGNTLTGTLPGSPNELLGTLNAADLIIKTNNSERMRILSTGNVGVNTGSTVNTTLDVNGSVAWRDGTALSTLANGTNNNVAIGSNSFFRITAGPTAAFSITGLTGGVDGRIVTLYNTTSQAMTLVNDATSTAANRIYTLSGTDLITYGPGIVNLQYNANVSRWLVISRQDKSTGGGGGSGPTPIYPDGTTYSDTKFQDYGTSDYTVPANTTLYITHTYLSGSVKVIVDNKVVAATAGGQTYQGGANNFCLSMPIVVGAGSVVRASTDAVPTATYASVGVANYFIGFEVVNSGVTAVTTDISGGVTYTVPAGKTLVLMNLFDRDNDLISISPGGGIWAPLMKGPSNYATVGGTATGTNVTRGDMHLQLLHPVIIQPGFQIRSDQATAGRVIINGYLR